MADRKTISKKLRFEVFKRDRFTCQYCGAKAPDVVLHVDHVRAVANGGDNDILNLVTACADCNGGKGARKLDDRSAVEKQRSQIEELEARREQLEMMLLWRDAAHAEAIDTVEALAARIEQRGKYPPNDSGKADIRRWLLKYSLGELLQAMDIAFDQYLVLVDGEPTDESWHTAFRKIPAIAGVRRAEADKPYLRRLFYIQGIFRNRWRMPREKYVSMLEQMHVEWGAPLDIIETAAKQANTTDELWGAIEAYSKGGR